LGCLFFGFFSAANSDLAAGRYRPIISLSLLNGGIPLVISRSYYGLDPDVIRELLGRKLSGRARQQIDDIADKTGRSVASCRRQVTMETIGIGSQRGHSFCLLPDEVIGCGEAGVRETSQMVGAV
jgi:hypothetical protein